MSVTISVLVHGARGLKIGRFDKNPYCELTIGSRTQSTKPDTKGKDNPTWGDKLDFKFEGESVVDVKLCAKSMTGGKVDLGEGQMELMKAYLEGQDKGEVAILKDGMCAGHVSITLTNPSKLSQSQNVAENQPPSVSEGAVNSNNEVGHNCGPSGVITGPPYINHEGSHNVTNEGITSMVPQHPDDHHHGLPQHGLPQHGLPQHPTEGHQPTWPGSYPNQGQQEQQPHFPMPPQFPGGGSGMGHPPQHVPWPGAYPPNVYPPGQYYPPQYPPPYYPQQPSYPPQQPGHPPQQQPGYPPQPGYQPQQPGNLAHSGGCVPPYQVPYQPAQNHTGMTPFPSDTINLTNNNNNNRSPFPDSGTCKVEHVPDRGFERKLSEASVQSG